MLAVPTPVATIEAAIPVEAAFTPFLRPSFVDSETAAFEFLLIQRFACRTRLLVVAHLDETEAA